MNGSPLNHVVRVASCQPPTSQSSRPRRRRAETSLTAHRQLPNCSDIDLVGAVEIHGTVAYAGIDSKVVAAIRKGLRPGVVGLKLHPARKAFFDSRLQRMKATGPVVQITVKILRPSRTSGRKVFAENVGRLEQNPGPLVHYSCNLAPQQQSHVLSYFRHMQVRR